MRPVAIVGHHLLWLENDTVGLRHNLAPGCHFALKLLTIVQNGLLRNFGDFGILGTPPLSLSRNLRARDCRYTGTCYGGPLLSFGGGAFDGLVQALFRYGPHIPSPPQSRPMKPIAAKKRPSHYKPTPTQASASIQNRHQGSHSSPGRPSTPLHPPLTTGTSPGKHEP